MTKEYEQEGNELIATLVGWKQFMAYEILDQWEAGDGGGGEELSNVWILNPTQKFLDLKKKYFGFNIEHKIFDCETENYYKDWNYGFNYNSDWNSLMPVVDICSKKVLELGDESKFEVAEWMFLTNNIEAVWHKVVEFIKYCNDENTKG